MEINKTQPALSLQCQEEYQVRESIQTTDHTHLLLVHTDSPRINLDYIFLTLHLLPFCYLSPKFPKLMSLFWLQEYSMIFFLFFLFLLMPPFHYILFSNCSSRFLGKLDVVEHNIVMSFRGNISEQKKRNISLLHTKRLINTLQCIHYFIYIYIFARWGNWG